MKTRYLSSITLALLIAPWHPAAAQNGSVIDSQRYHDSAERLGDDTPEEPPTTRMRVENVRERHQEAVTGLTALFNRIPADPTLISSKEVVDAIDQGDRAMTRTKTACDAILATLRGAAKTIKAEPSFTEEQQQELLVAVESMTRECEELSGQATAAGKHLAGSYKAMAKWRKVYKTYLNLEGAPKAAEQLKAAVVEYVKAFTAAPATPAVAALREKPE